MTDMEARPIPGTNLDVMSPFFSPDGQSIGFYSFQDSTLKKVAVTGGLPVTICQTDLPPFGPTWDRDWIVFADQGAEGILRVSPNGGVPEVLVAVQAGEVFAAPQMLNDGGDLLFTVTTGQATDRWDRAHIVAQSAGSKERRVILQGGSEGDRGLPVICSIWSADAVRVPFDVSAFRFAAVASRSLRASGASPPTLNRPGPASHFVWGNIRVHSRPRFWRGRANNCAGEP